MQSLFDFQKNGIYRDRVETFLIDRLSHGISMSQPHYHPYYELFYIVDGSCKMFVEHSLFNCCPGDLIILPEGVLHRSQYEKNVCVERITFSFTQNFASSLDQNISHDFLEKNFPLIKIHFEGSGRNKIEELFEKLLVCFNFLDAEDEKTELPAGVNVDGNAGLEKIQVNVLVLQIFLAVIRKALETEPSGREQLIDEVTDKIQSSAKFIFENFSSDISLSQAASIAGMSETYFSRKFHEITGYSFKEYLTNVRIQHAIKMLQACSCSVTQIATTCGFSDGNYFGDAFRKKTGLSPRDFRKTCRHQEKGNDII